MKFADDNLARCRCGRAFTLIEMLAASALTAVLSVAVLNTTASFGRASAALAKRGADPSAEALIELLRRDVANCTSVQSSDSGVVMSGSCGLDPRALGPSHRPVRVIYSVQQNDSHRWLVRDQSPQDAVDAKPWRQIASGGVQQFQLLAVTGSSGTSTGLIGYRAIITWSDPNRARCDELLLVR